MACAAGLLLLSCLSEVVNPAKAWLLVPLEILFWPLLAVNLFLVVWSLLRRSKAVFIPLVAIVPALFFLGRYVQFKGADGPAEGERSVKVVSYNVGRFRSYPNRLSSQACQDSVIRFLRSTDADIICLQEFYVANGQSIQVLMQSLLSGYVPTYYLYTGKKGKFGNVILSRYPLRNKGHVEFDSSVNLALWADYRIGDQTVRVYNCHLESYNISPAGLAEKLRGKRDKEVIEDTGRKMRRSIRQRASQVEQVFKEIDNSPVAAIICGDFNDTPLSYTYYKTMRGHRDSFKQAGKGIGASYPSSLPFIRLDYILCPRTMRAVSYDCPRLKYSDHRPVATEFVFEKE